MSLDRHSPLEFDLRRQGFRFIAGVDEVGRGPLAGPVVAAACLIPEGVRLFGIRDSKKLTPETRKKLFGQIIRKTLVGVGVVSQEEIDRINILQASLLAMRLAVEALSVTPDVLLIDGSFKINYPLPQLPVVGGDDTLISVGAASIVAKVTRDEMMDQYDLQFPQYGFRSHKGYPTEAHIAALEEHGPCFLHRMTFSPLHRFRPVVPA